MSGEWSSISADGLEPAEGATSGERSFRIRSLPDPSLGWIGRGHDERTAFVLLVDANSPVPKSRPAYEHIEIQHGCVVEIQEAETSRQVEASVLVCKSHDPGTVKLFERSVSGAISVYSGPLKRDDLDAVVSRLRDLFGNLPPTSEEAVLGLWGELFVIANAVDLEVSLDCWRLREASRVDFSDDHCVVDVKTTESLRRVHHVAQSQLRPRSGLPAFVVSLQTEKQRVGLSIRELWSDIARRSPSHQDQLSRTIIRTLGAEWERVQDYKFDAAAASQSFAVFNTADVPVVDPLPPAVLNAKYEIDFDRVPLAAMARSSSGLLRALMPRRQA